MARRKHTAKFKFTCVKESLEKDTVTEVARKYGINPNQLSTWRNQFLESGHQVFETTTDKEITNLRKQVSKLEQLVGKKEVELSLLKNYLDFYTSPDGS